MDANAEKVLADLGFTPDDALKAQIEKTAEDLKLSESGPYVVHGAWSKGDLKIHLEQNTAPEGGDDELTALVTHPPLLIVEKGDKRLFAIRPRDADSLREIVPTL